MVSETNVSDLRPTSTVKESSSRRKIGAMIHNYDLQTVEYGLDDVYDLKNRTFD